MKVIKSQSKQNANKLQKEYNTFKNKRAYIKMMTILLYILLSWWVELFIDRMQHFIHDIIQYEYDYEYTLCILCTQCIRNMK